MNYASIRSMDISNGEGIGVALFVQGCHFHCENCFNSETWDFNSGKNFGSDEINEIIKLASKPYITRLSVLGGEPLCNENIDEVFATINRFKKTYSDKKVWLYTGYTLEELKREYGNCYIDEVLLENIDILVDGRYIDELKDYTLQFRGSSNQRIIDVKETLKQGKIVLKELKCKPAEIR